MQISSSLIACWTTALVIPPAQHPTTAAPCVQSSDSRGSVSMVAADPVGADLESLVAEPNEDLTPVDVIRNVCLGLQHNDYPKPDGGIERLYHFMTPQGRVTFAPPAPKSGLQGGVTLEDFMKDAAGPALGALVLCSEFKLLGELTQTPGSRTRGAWATQMIEVINEPEAEAPPVYEDAEIELLTALVKAPDDFLARVLESQRRGLEPPPPPLRSKQTAKIPTSARFVIKLEQERRPPLAGCWRIMEFHSLARTRMQILAEGGEEFEGEDTG